MIGAFADLYLHFFLVGELTDLSIYQKRILYLVNRHFRVNSCIHEHRRKRTNSRDFLINLNLISNYDVHFWC